ncbi:TPA: hypothetical protein UMZ03_000156 [Stenotrophomonas maltophilia]|nr:hypothetical protein [Stenotrophomonas maltophilia]HEL3849493.1 hypothetical protein [Stenotrophomonas maltophilia]
MDAIEKRARQWLADGLRSKYPDDIATRMVISQLLNDELDFINARVAVKVLAAALTPPEGYVLVPVEVRDLYDFMAITFTPFTGQHQQIKIQLELARQAVLADSPEVKP